MIQLENLSVLPPDNLSKIQGKETLRNLREELTALQHKLFLHNKNSVLIIIQGVDTSGKDGIIRHVISGMNPSGVRVKSFKVPTAIEQRHDFMWRIYPHFPETEMIQVFNRSHYEDVLVPFVNGTIEDDLLESRMRLINSIEENLTNNGTKVIKLFLHISKDEQLARIQERKTNPLKRWKYSPNDDDALSKYSTYQQAYNLILNKCTHPTWHVIPSDKRWYRNMRAAEIILTELKELLSSSKF